MNKTVLLAAILMSGPLGAQEAGVDSPDVAAEAEVMIDRNSQSCDFTFFSNGDDTLDLRGNTGSSCFDLKAGRDILSLDPENFPEGTRVFTGPGRDIVVLPDGPDYVVGYDDTDEEYVLRGGDDEVVIDGRLATGGRTPGTAPKTVIRPGSGQDRISFGMNGSEGVVRFRSPDLEIWGDEPGSTSFDGYCGRIVDDRFIDVTFPLNRPDRSVDVRTDGCGLSFPRQSGPLNLYQEGGRLSLSMRRESAIDPVVPATLSARVRDGSALALSVETAAGASNFEWQGYGLAAINADFSSDDMGGSYKIASQGTVYGSIGLGAGNASFDMKSARGIELAMSGALGDNAMSVYLSAPTISINWSVDAGRFPDVNILDQSDVVISTGLIEADHDEVRSILREDVARKIKEELAAIDVVDPSLDAGEADEVVKPEAETIPFDDLSDTQQRELFYSALHTKPKTEVLSVETQSVELRIDRLSRDGHCYDVKVIDYDGKNADLSIDCMGDTFAEHVEEFEEILLTSGARKVSFKINEGSKFRVDTLVVRN